MNSMDYWQKQHLKYLTFDWIDKPTIFAQSITEYLPKTGEMLELGCGQGQDSQYFAKKGYKVTATDFSDQGLELARKKTQKQNLNINYENVNLTKKLPYEDESFDIVYSHLALHYFNKETTTQIFNEIDRVLKTQGIIAILVNTTDDNETKEGNKMIEKDLYEVNGIVKRYFSVNTLNDFIKDKFDILLLDNQGETHKDKIKSLIRLVGQKK